ncbi:MAG TPA: Holliday junction resolvase RuvX [bacterium]|nr:Holliday junction resolvase RuvX [bacterium]
MAHPGRIVALDFGTRKIGVAISDALQITAAPLKTIRYRSRETLFEELRSLIRDREVIEVVVGVPYTMRGGESHTTREVKEFITWLAENLDIPVQTIDERLSSQQAKQTLQEMGVRTGHEKDRVDAMAASHLLRLYLDSRGDVGGDRR